MRTSDIIVQFDYNYWATDKILLAASNINQNDLLDEGSHSYGSILGLLSHMFNAEAMWLQRCRDGISPATVRYETPCDSLQELTAAWKSEKLEFYRYLNMLTDQQLDQQIMYKGFSGREFNNTLWHILMQIINHGASHRAELAGKLTELGHSPGDLDFLIYLRQ